MPGLSVPTTSPDGRRMMVESDVLALDARIKNGDGTVGWAGDPGMWLEFDQIADVFIVCRHDPNTGGVEDVLRYAPPLDVGLLIKLRDGDTHRAGNDPVARMLAEEAKRERDEQDEFETYIEEEVAPRLTHALDQGGVDTGRAKSFSLWTPPR